MKMLLTAITQTARKKTSRSLFLLMLVSALFISAAELPLFSATPVRPVTEDEIKAAYLYRFLLFLNLPHQQDENDDFFRITIIGNDTLSQLFDSVSGKQVGTSRRNLEVSVVKEWDDKKIFKNNHILYIPAAYESETEKILEHLEGHAVLTVSDAENFLDRGGMVQFTRLGAGIRWEINRTAVKNASIELSSQLYRNALRVINP